MKFLAWFIGLLVLLVMGFLAIGVVKPSVSYQVQTQVAATPTEAFDVFIDVGRMSEWLEGFERIENLSGAPGEVGSRWRLHFVDERGAPMVFEEEVTGFIPGELFSYRGDSPFTMLEASTEFEPVEGGTRITMTADLQGKGIIWRSMMALSQGQLKARSEADFARLKRLIESG